MYADRAMLPCPSHRTHICNTHTHVGVLTSGRTSKLHFVAHAHACVHRRTRDKGRGCGSNHRETAEAVCCGVLRCVVVCCSVLQKEGGRRPRDRGGSVLWCVAGCDGVLQCVAVSCRRCGGDHHETVEAVCCSVLR